jgi:hypothetical protein
MPAEMDNMAEENYLVICWSSVSGCRLTHKPAETGRYASGEENGEDMRQIF